MYPFQYFSMFPPFPRTNRVFFAMSFDARFEARWKNVMQPAARAVRVGDQPLEAYRVDQSKKGDSILVEILREVETAQVIVADVTALDYLNTRPIRNANALYELGIAHASRLPEDVIVVRSDDYPLDFDIANVRVHRYDPDGDEDSAAAFLTDLIRGAIDARDESASIAVKRVAEMLDADAWMFLLRTSVGEVTLNKPKGMGQMLGYAGHVPAIRALLAHGLVTAVYKPITAELVNADNYAVHGYDITPFGRAVVLHTGLDRLQPDALALLEGRERESGKEDAS